MKKLLLVVVSTLTVLVVDAQPPLWSKASENALSRTAWVGKQKPKAYQLFKLNRGSMESALRQAPSEKSTRPLASGAHIQLPDASGMMQTFSIVEAPVAAPGLLQKFPGNQSYSGVSTTNPAMQVRFSYTLYGLNAIIYAPDQPITYIKILDQQNQIHIVVSEKDMVDDYFECTTTSTGSLRSGITRRVGEEYALNANDGNIHTFRLALAASAEFSDKYDNDPENDDGDAARKNAVIAYQMTHLTFSNFYLERDFGIRLIMISNNDELIYLDPDTDPWNSDNDDGEYNSSTQTAIDAVIGSDNYDIGHLMRQSIDGTSKGNAGDIGSICKNSTKGSGFTTRGNWDAVNTYTEMMFTHELGHQSGANHTFGHLDDNDNAQMEPGSGSTIMSYGGNGIAPASQAFVPYRDKYFHAISIQQVTDYVSGVSCGTIISANNTPPTANAGPDFSIPKSTPFVLTGSASDNEGDALTYTWEQMDKLTDGGDFPRIPSSTDTYGPDFRSREPSTSPSRTMPIDGIANDWEVLPSVERTLNFRFTVRDNNPGGAQNNSDDMVVTIADAGPFVLTAPNGGETICPGNYDITWDVNGTDALAANVKISLSTDGGVTYPTIITASTPNDGSYTYNFPCTYNNMARIKIEAVGNIFFDFSNNNFTYGDNTKPTFTVPSDVTITKDENCAYNANPATTGEPTNVNDNCDGSPGVTYSDVESAGSCVGETVVTRTWKVQDACGNFTEKNQIITVKDVTAPTFTVPANTIIYKDENCEYNADPAETGSPTEVSDNCDPAPAVTYSDVVVPGSCMGEEIITRTWKVTDDCGNFSEDVQVITAKDTTAPTFSNVSASPNSLWPPNHKMKEVTINYDVADNCSDFDHITTSLTIESNEPINGTGDGDTEPIDYEVIDNHTVLLRAERAGTGDGRVYTITIKAVDDCGNISYTTTEVYVAHNISAPYANAAFKVGSTVNFSGVFQDKAGNTHKAKWIIDETTTARGTITSEPSGRKNGTAAGSYKFNDPGVYKLKISIIDQNGNESYATTSGDQEATVVIFDPSGGNAYGGGWFASPAGAYKANTSLTGKASFGFEVHYFKKATYPKGETRFELKVGDFEFTAVNFEYMAINGQRAQMMGSGKITGGQSGVNFILTVVDNGDADYVRMKIYNKNTGEVYYDNEPGNSDAAMPSTRTGNNSVIEVINNKLRSSAEYVKTDPMPVGLTASPNPSHNTFTLRVDANAAAGAVTLRVLNSKGTSVEQRTVSAGATLQIGQQWIPGIYLVEARQGEHRKVIRLLKL